MNCTNHLLHYCLPTSKPSAKFRCEQIRSICQVINDTNLVSTLDIMVSFQSFCLPALQLWRALLSKRNSSCNDLVLRYNIALLFPVSVFAMLTVEMYSASNCLLHVSMFHFLDFFNFIIPILCLHVLYGTILVYSLLTYPKIVWYVRRLLLILLKH